MVIVYLSLFTLLTELQAGAEKDNYEDKIRKNNYTRTKPTTLHITKGLIFDSYKIRETICPNRLGLASWYCTCCNLTLLTSILGFFVIVGSVCLLTEHEW